MRPWDIVFTETGRRNVKNQIHFSPSAIQLVGNIFSQAEDQAHPAQFLLTRNYVKVTISPLSFETKREKTRHRPTRIEQ